jgi:hypothetical protein
MALGSEWNLVQGEEINLEVSESVQDSNGVTRNNVLTASQDGPITHLLDGSVGGFEKSFQGEITYLPKGGYRDASDLGLVFGSKNEGDYNGFGIEALYAWNKAHYGFGAGSIDWVEETEANRVGLPTEGWQKLKVQIWFPSTEGFSVNLWHKSIGDDSYSVIYDRRNYTSPMSGIDDLTNVLGSGIGFSVGTGVYISDVSLGF